MSNDPQIQFLEKYIETLRSEVNNPHNHDDEYKKQISRKLKASEKQLDHLRWLYEKKLDPSKQTAKETQRKAEGSA